MSQKILQNLAEVNKILNLKFWSRSLGRSLTSDEEKKFKFLHFNRNYFNDVASNVTTLTQLYHTGFYEDNNGNTWRVLPTIMNKFHMPDSEYNLNSKLGLSKAWSRKFVKWDDRPWGGEYELIVKGDGEAIDGSNKANGEMLATYNFGKTATWLRHQFLDIDPHFNLSELGSYIIYPQKKGNVTISESKTLQEYMF